MGVVGKTLVTGAGGLLAPYLVEAFDAVATGRRGGDISCDLADAAAVRRLVEEVRPAVVVHAAAMTNIDRAEVDPAAADLANRVTTENLVAAMPQRARLLYISTDQVYPDVAGPHVEGSEAPVNVYGTSKLAGEHAALRHPRALVARTNLFGPSRTPGRASLSDFVLDGLRNGKVITLFRDVLFSPLHMTTLAAVLREMIVRELVGVYNVGSREGMSKADFGLAIAEHLGLSPDHARIGVSTELPNRAPRIGDLRVDVSRLEASLERAMPTCRDEIDLL